MHIGLIGGIGPAATEFYYRALVKLYKQAERQLELTIVNADARELVGHLEAGESAAQAAIFARYIDRLKAGGCEAAAITSMGGHFCLKDLAPISSLPLISAVTALEEYFSAAGIGRVGVLGTRAVMESGLYGLSSAEVVTVPVDELQTAHAHYTAIAVSGHATDEQRAYFETAASRLINSHGAEAVVLGGTDLFLAFDKPGYPYRIVDSAQVHAEAIARVGLG
ncbi:aspartate/glutamate racemase family protein [Acidocella sp.]|jgi:aspartate racemase|uniref:aspartate/glutamate racemase family protein n=1 Tax=Acidocella sp. TaxID=50710 RepID=UPI002F41335E